MTRLRRAFVAAVPPPAVLDAVEQRTARLAAAEPDLRWTPRAQWHVTLQFLGAVHDADALTAALGGAVARRSPFDAELAGGGAFPSPRRATVLWIGVAPPHRLVGLAAAVQEATGPLGHPPERRGPHPHLTIARAARPRSLTRLVDALGADAIGPPWSVAEVALVESDTRPEGAVHTVRARLPLRGA